MATRAATRRKSGRSTRRPSGNGKAASVQVQDHAEVLHGFDDKFLDCRDLRHPWTRVGYFRQGVLIRRRLVCERCGTERLDRWRHTRSGVIREPATYTYATGYRVRGESFNAAEIREELLSRVDIYDSEQQLLESFANGGRRRQRRAS